MKELLKDDTEKDFKRVYVAQCYSRHLCYVLAQAPGICCDA
jgi:hypothetical protein